MLKTKIAYNSLKFKVGYNAKTIKQGSTVNGCPIAQSNRF